MCSPFPAGAREKQLRPAPESRFAQPVVAAGGSVEKAQQMANHSDPRTTKLYDRREDDASLDEYEKVGI